MNNKEARKIQFGGYTGRSFKEIRHKIKNVEDESFKTPPRKWDKNICKKTKKPHNFVLVDDSRILTFRFKNYECSDCGKKKWESIK